VFAAFTTGYAFKVGGSHGNLSWGIHDDNTLRIYGSGDMEYADFKQYPWSNHSDTVTAIVVDCGVTSINGYAFYDFTKVSRVSLPADGNKDNKIAILEHAFLGCTSLQSIDITTNVWAMDGRAFKDTGLTRAVFARTEGWRLEDAATGVLVTGLADPAVAAEHLTSTYADKHWFNRWFV
jgi:hypothetical protein